MQVSVYRDCERKSNFFHISVKKLKLVLHTIQNKLKKPGIKCIHTCQKKKSVFRLVRPLIHGLLQRIKIIVS